MAAVDVMPPAASWEGLKRQADAAFNKGEYIQAVTFYGNAIDTAFKNKTEDSACAKLFANRALTYQRAGKWAECIADSMTAIRLDCSYVKGWWRLGTALAKIELKPEAKRAFETGLSLEPRNAELQGQLRSLEGDAGVNSASISGNNPELGNIKLQVDRTIAEAQDKLKRKPDRASSPSLMNGHAPGSFNATGISGTAAKSVKAQKRARQKARKALQHITDEEATENTQNKSNMNGNGAHAAPSAMQTDALDREASGDASMGDASSGSDSSTDSDASDITPQLQPQSVPSQPATSEPAQPAESADPSESERARGTKLYQQGDWQGALQAYKAAADLAPDVAANPANCAAAALMLRQFKCAADFAAQAAALQPSFIRAHIRAGKACLCMGRFDQAAAHYQRALQIDATNSTAKSEAALVEHARRNIEAGNAILETDARQAQWYADVASRQITPVLEPAAMLRCKALMRMGKHAEALGETRSLTVEGESAAAEVLTVRAEALYGSGNMERAMKMYEEALRRDPDSTTSARGLKRLRAMTNAKEAGNAAFKSRQWAEALQQYSVALKDFNPAQGNETFFAQCFGNRSAVHMKMRKHKEALQDADAAIDADRSFAKGYLRRAAANEALENFEDAVRDYEKVKGMEPETPGINDLLRNAKLLLKKSKRVDYYKLLDISQDANDYDIKKAYKRAALKYHPDKASADDRDEAEKKFKQVNAANSILSDPAKRQRYDAGWTDEEIEQGAPEGAGYGGGGGGAQMDDILAAMFAQRQASSGGGRGFGGGGFPFSAGGRGF